MLAMSTRPDQRTNWWIVAATGVAVFIAQLDTSVVNVALPTIERELDIGTSLTQWVVLGYVLPMIALSLPSGRWLDGVGHRPVLLFAMLGFALASVAVGLAPGAGWLLGARVVQGSFAAVLFALVPVLTTVAARPGQLGRAMGVVMSVGILGGVSGPVLGGFVVEHLGWPWIFYLNVPASLVVVGIALAQIPAGRPLRWPGRRAGVEIGLLGVAVVAVMLALTLTAERGPRWLPLAVAAVPFFAVWLHGRSSAPVLELLRTRGRSRPYVALMAETTGLMAVMFLTPFHLQRAAGATPTEIGLAMLASPLAVLVFGPVGGALADRWTPHLVAAAGAALLTVGIVSTIPLSAHWGTTELAVRLAVIGAGAGLFVGPNQTIAMASAPRHLLGTAGAATSMARQLGMALGPALATTFWALPGYDGTGMRMAVGLAAVAAASSVLALVAVRR